jgi:hypothetical protein
LKHAFIKICTFVLDSQFVKLPDETEAIWKVRLGAGMGLLCAPDIANVAFAVAAESGNTLATDHLEHYNILAYWRYMDDGLVLGHGRRGDQLEFFHAVMTAASEAGFTMKVESVSAISCVFLDLFLSKEGSFARSGRLDIKVHRKPTSLAQPLRPSSHHPLGVHLSWPRAMLARSRRLCSRLEAFEEDREVMMNCWKQYEIWAEGGTAGRPLAIRLPNPAPTCRLVVPYHRCWQYAGLLAILKKFQPEVQRTLEMHVDLDVAWSLGYQHLRSLIRRDSGVYHGYLHFQVFLEE